MNMEAPQEAPQRRSHAEAAAQGFVPEVVPTGKQGEVEAIDKKIAALNSQKQKGREVLAKITDERMRSVAIDAAEKAEETIDAEIDQLELQKREVLGQKPN